VVEIIYTGHADRDDVWATSLQKLAPIGDRHGIEFLRCDYRCELNIAILSTAHAWTVPNRAARAIVLAGRIQTIFQGLLTVGWISL